MSTFLHFLPNRQPLVLTCPETYRGYLYSMHASAIDNVWMAVSLPYGDTGRVAVFHWNGTVYTQHDFTSSNIPTNMGTNIFTYGASDTYLWTGNEVAHWNGGVWAVVFTNPNMDGEGCLLGGTSTPLYLVLRLYGGVNGGVAVYTGSGLTWTHQYDTVFEPDIFDPTTIYHPGDSVRGIRTCNPSGGDVSGAAYCVASREHVSSGSVRYCVLDVSSDPAVRLHLMPTTADGMTSLSNVGGTWFYSGQALRDWPSTPWQGPQILVSPSWSEITENSVYAYPNAAIARSAHGVSSTDLWVVGDVDVDPSVGDYRLFLDHDTGSWTHAEYTPASAGYHTFNQVFALATDDVWVIGQLCDEGPPAPTTIVLHWNGTLWSRRDLPVGS